MEDWVNLHSQQKYQLEGHFVDNSGNAEGSKLLIIKFFVRLGSHEVLVIQVDK
jgi:hypothetical protein